MLTLTRAMIESAPNILLILDCDTQLGVFYDLSNKFCGVISFLMHRNNFPTSLKIIKKGCDINTTIYLKTQVLNQILKKTMIFCGECVIPPI